MTNHNEKAAQKVKKVHLFVLILSVLIMVAFGFLMAILKADNHYTKYKTERPLVVINESGERVTYYYRKSENIDTYVEVLKTVYNDENCEFVESYLPRNIVYKNIDGFEHVKETNSAEEYVEALLEIYEKAENTINYSFIPDYIVYNKCE